MTGNNRTIDGRIRDDGGPTRTFLSIYFEDRDRDVLPAIDKNPLRLNFDGVIYEGTVSLRTSHPPYLLTTLQGPNGPEKCTDLFLRMGLNNGAVLRFRVTRPGQKFKYLHAKSTGSPLTKGDRPSRSKNMPRQPVAQSAVPIYTIDDWDRSTVELWAKRYWDTISPADKQAELTFDVDFAKAREAGFLSRSLFVRIGVWKAARNRFRLETNTPEAIKAATRKAYRAASRSEAILTLCELTGVAVRTATAMLHWMRPGEFPMLDFRIVRALGFDEPTSYEDLSFYETVAQRAQALAQELGVDLRTLDRALWAFDRQKNKSAP